MLGKALGYLATFLIQAAVALLVSPFTPHPVFASLLVFMLVRSVGLQITINRLNLAAERDAIRAADLAERIRDLETSEMRMFLDRYDRYAR